MTDHSFVPQHPAGTDIDPGGLVFTQLVDEVPTAHEDASGPLGWSVNPMPASDAVARFVGKFDPQCAYSLLEPRFDSVDAYNPWWRGFDAADAPVDTWAESLDDHETLLLDQCCRVLSSHMSSELIRQLKLSGTYPPDWGSGAGQFRATGDRFFDRLRLTFLSQGIVGATANDNGGSRRVGSWTSSSGLTMDPQTTIFARRHADNGFHALQVRLTQGGTTLGTLAGLAAVPDNFAFPLAWSEAVHPGLGPDIEAKLPGDLRARLNGFANDVDAALDGADKVVFWARLAGVGGLLFWPTTAVMSLLAAGVADKLGDAVEHWPAALRRAAASSADLDDVAYELLHMLRITDYDGVFEHAIESALGIDESVLFVGLSRREVSDIESALRPTTGAPFAPMILLGDAFAEYGRKFGNAPFGPGHVALKEVKSQQRVANALWTQWWNTARPTVDLAYVLETVGIVAQQLLHLDDALLAAESLANGEGLIAASLRSAVVDQDQAAFADALGGVSLSAGVRYLLRQTLSDLFIDWVAMDEEKVPAGERSDPEGIHAVFTWMDSSTKRATIDDALGPVIEVTEENAGDMWEGFSKLRIYFNYPSDYPLSARGWLLPNVPEDEQGAFGRMLSALSASATSGLPAPDISLVDLALVRDWVTRARGCDLVYLREQLEPLWAPAGNGLGHPPGDLTGTVDVKDVDPLRP